MHTQGENVMVHMYSRATLFSPIWIGEELRLIVSILRRGVDQEVEHNRKLGQEVFEQQHCLSRVRPRPSVRLASKTRNLGKNVCTIIGPNIILALN